MESSLDCLPALPGSYALHLTLAEPARLQIGRLGVFDFPPGGYLYLGSARGPGGLRARLRHHARTAGKPHWHIDYLRAAARLEGVWISTNPARLECAWSQASQQLPGARIPVPGFGAGDCACGCAAHLVGFPGELRPLDEWLTSRIKDRLQRGEGTSIIRFDFVDGFFKIPGLSR